MNKNRIPQRTWFLLLAWLVAALPGFSYAFDGECLNVQISDTNADSINLEIKATNPSRQSCMGTIAVTIDGGDPVVRKNPDVYDLFPPGGPGKLACFVPYGEGWTMGPVGKAIVPAKMHVELYNKDWERGAQKELCLPIKFTKSGAVRILVRSTFAKREEGRVIVDCNFPRDGEPDEQGLPCLVYTKSLNVDAGGTGNGGANPPASGEEGRMQASAPAISTENAYVDKAKSVIFPKSKTNIRFKVLQSLPDGALCIAGVWDTAWQKIVYSGELFYWVDSTNAFTADDEEFQDDLYWCGTYSYTTVKDIHKTVHAYTSDLDKAVATVRYNFGLYDAPPYEEAVTSNDRPGNVSILGSGTGFFVTQQGHILTNYHVISEGRIITVTHGNGECHAAEIIAADSGADLALIKIDAPGVPVTFGSNNVARLGQTVFTLGYPSPDIQGFSPKVTMGVISSLTGLMGDAKSYQIDAAVQPGNSGGPLFSSTGEVLGVVFARVNDLAYTEITGAVAQKINYAIKNSSVMTFLQKQPDVLPYIKCGTVNALTQEEAVGVIQKSLVLISTFSTEGQ